MMNDPKSFASLTPTLLARKGGARPAMRPQLQPMPHFDDGLARDYDDLGWNDMGEDVPHGEVVSLVPDAPIAPAPVPEVVRQQEAIAERVAAPIAAVPAPRPVAALQVPARDIAHEVAPEPVRTAPKPARPRRSALSDGRRAAFTLRVDSERHLKLRLACALRNRSAQQLVTDALDRLLDELPDVASLAAQVVKKH